MSCNGNYHPPSCTCDFRGGWRGNFPQVGAARFTVDSFEGAKPAVSIQHLAVSRTVESITIPNARCPVCGWPVFFYQNNYGSRVFFDALGKPWPKHGCTDNEIYRYPRSAKIAAPEEPPAPRDAWREAGWRPFHVFESLQPCVFLQSYEKDEYLSLALLPETLESALPVVFVKFESDSRLAISYFHNGLRDSLELSSLIFHKLAGPPADPPIRSVLAGAAARTAQPPKR